jgi:hypothetical protein
VQGVHYARKAKCLEHWAVLSQTVSAQCAVLFYAVICGCAGLTIFTCVPPQFHTDVGRSMWAV